MKIALVHNLKKPKEQFFVYALLCPFTSVVKYVGLSTVGFRRLQQHYNCGTKTKPTKIRSWIKSLRTKRKCFEVQYLEYFTEDGPHIDESEMKWIKFYKDQGLELLNHDMGGRSHYCKYHNEENKKIQSEKYKELFNTPEMKQKFSKITLAQWQNPEIRAKMCEANKKPKSESHRKNQSKAQTKAKGVVIQSSTGQIFNSMQEAADFFNVSKSVIQRALYANTSKLGDIKLTRIGGGVKPPDQLRPMNSYYQRKT